MQCWFITCLDLTFQRTKVEDYLHRITWKIVTDVVLTLSNTPGHNMKAFIPFNNFLLLNEHLKNTFNITAHRVGISHNNPIEVGYMLQH